MVYVAILNISRKAPNIRAVVVVVIMMAGTPVVTSLVAELFVDVLFIAGGAVLLSIAGSTGTRTSTSTSTSSNTSTS